jgi:hypothetical protein
MYTIEATDTPRDIDIVFKKINTGRFTPYCTSSTPGTGSLIKFNPEEGNF